MKRAALLQAGVLVVVVGLSGGCRNGAAPSTPAGGAGPAPTAAATPATTPAYAPAGGRVDPKTAGPAGGPIRRGMDRAEAQNQLRQIGTFYTTYRTEMGQTPAKLEDFLTYIQRDATREYQSLKSGYFTLNLVANPTGETPLAYETTPYTDGSRLVLFGDGSSVRIVSAADFEAALKGK